MLTNRKIELTSTMKTRQQYLNKEISHFDFYAQFVDEQVKTIVRNVLKKKGYLNKLAQTIEEDENLNNIPLSFWDSFSQNLNTAKVCAKMKSAGDYLTLSGIICIAKTAAKIIAKENHE